MPDGNSAAKGSGRKKRPRPTFEDGSLTRVFKFPSKSYPRSTYYVTASEIIIRIKKARKKWKLVIPKKRVVSYRTNRWFATPRWVEIELTFTQANRLGFVQPRPSAPRTAGETTEAQPVDQTLAESGGTFTIDTSPGDEPDTASTDEAVPEIEALEPDDEGWVLDTGSDDAGEDSQAVGEQNTEIGAADEPGLPEGDEPVVVDQAAVPSEALHGADPLGHENENETEATGSSASVLAAEDVEPVRADIGIPVETPLEAASVASQDAWRASAEIDMRLPESGPACQMAPVVLASSDFSLAGTVCEPVASAATIDSDLPEGKDVSSVPAIHLASNRPRRRAPASWLAILMLAIAGPVAAWIVSSDFSTKPTEDGPQAELFEPAPFSTRDIVTGSVDKAVEAAPGEVDVPSLPEDGPLASPAVEPPTIPDETIEPEVSAPAPALDAHEPMESVPETQEVPDAAAAIPHADEQVPPVIEPAIEEAVPLSPTPELQPEPKPEPQPPEVTITNEECLDLPAVARSIRIHFDYASASLVHAPLDALDDFARRLRSCRTGAVIIEGHTDSDGDEGRNHAVSVRRAEAVRDHLVNAGARAEQLTVIGFGRSRPAVPNDSPRNKHLNRRAVLVLEAPR